jgi:hypothetical protein
LRIKRVTEDNRLWSATVAAITGETSRNDRQTYGRTFEWRQGITEAPLEKYPECQGPVQRLAGGEAGFILKGVWLEVLLLAGVTGLTSEVEKIAALTRRIQPQRGLLNTVARPPSEDFAGPVSWSQLQEFANLFDGKAEVISEDHQSRSPVSDQATEADILALLNRRPCTVQGVSAGLGLPVGETAKRLAALLEERLATTVRINKTIFYETVRAKAN